MVALKQQIRIDHARLDSGRRVRPGSIAELAGRHEFHRPQFQRHVTIEPRIDPLHWVIALLVAGSFVFAILALVGS